MLPEQEMNSNREGRNKPEVLIGLEQYLLSHLHTILPGNPVSCISIETITAGVSVINDPNQQESAGYNAKTCTLRHYLPVEWNINGYWKEPHLVVSDRTSRDGRSYCWYIPFSEVAIDIRADGEVTKEYLQELMRSSVHEGLHAITLNTLWNIDGVNFHRILDDVSATMKSQNKAQEYDAFLQSLFWSYPHTSDPSEAYKTAIKIKQKVVNYLSSFMTSMDKEIYIKTAFYFGMSEIVSHVLEDKFKPFHEEIIHHYANAGYALFSAAMIYPTPDQHERILRILKDISFPLTSDSLSLLQSLGEDHWYTEF